MGRRKKQPDIILPSPSDDASIGQTKVAGKKGAAGRQWTSRPNIIELPSRRKNRALVLPEPPDEGSIEQTTIYPTIDAMFAEEIAKLPWFEQYSRETRRTIRFAFVTAVAETLRTVAFRLNSDQSWDVYDEFGKEITAFNKELLNGDDMRAAAILGLSS